jgi:site-specific recombinase XerD
MRRAAVVNLNLEGVDLDNRKITVLEKGGHIHSYKIHKDHVPALRDYMEKERLADSVRWGESNAFFLPASTVANSSGRLTAVVVNQVWKAVCEQAGVMGKTPHCARHAVGLHFAKQENGIAKVQRQLGHKNPASSVCYARPTERDIEEGFAGF